MTRANLQSEIKWPRNLLLKLLLTSISILSELSFQTAVFETEKLITDYKPTALKLPAPRFPIRLAREPGVRGDSCHLVKAMPSRVNLIIHTLLKCELDSLILCIFQAPTVCTRNSLLKIWLIKILPARWSMKE